MNTRFPNLAATASLIVLAAGLSGCAAMDRLEHIGQPPRLTAVDNPAGRQIVASIPAPKPARHDDNSLWQPGSHSFFRDPRASKVGDIITVNVSVADAAKLKNTSSRRRDNSDNANLSNFVGLEKVLPSNVDPTSLLNMGSKMSNVGTGAIDRSESIDLTLAALVAQVLPNGNLVIDGNQEVRVNNELRNLQVAGIVRREDITQNNTVNLSQIAEARISYGGRGQITDVQQPRYGSQVLDVLMPW
jgi:flagellar L-ring protein precursor FlgH